MKNSLLALLLLLGVNIGYAQTYSGAESVEYDPVNKQWLASNGSSIIADDGHGNLSYFGNGATSFGVEVMGNTLFGIGNGGIKGYDLTTTQEVMSLSIAGASFLNGLTNDGGGNLYASDFGASKIYKIDVSDLSAPSYEVIVDDLGSTPNGLVYDAMNNRLVIAGWGSNAPIKAVDLTDNTVTTLVTTNLGNIDGIDEDNDGNFYLSSWSPNQISKYDNAFANPIEVISVPFAISNVADICYAKQNDTLALPQGNKVQFLDLSPDTVVMTNTSLIEEASIPMGVYPNPISHESFIQFELAKQEYIDLSIFNQQGQKIETLLNGVQQKGVHKVLLINHQLPVGVYFCHLSTKNASAIRKIVVIE